MSIPLAQSVVPITSPARVAVVGFGYIGSVIGAVLADRGLHVIGVEPNPRIVEAVAAGRSPVPEPGMDDLIHAAVASGRLVVGHDPAGVSEADVVLLAVGTPLGEAGTSADTGQLAQAARAVAPFLHDGQLVVVKSTVPPGTTRDVIAPIVRGQARQVHVAFCPERLAEGRAIEEFRSIPIVVGGVDAESTAAAASFFRGAMGVEVIEVGSSLGAELVKLADNLWIDLNIALANELAKLADALGGIDVLEVIRAANSLPKGEHHVNILTPSLGVGGYCLTKDPWFVHDMGRRHGLELATPVTSRTVNDGMADYTAALIGERVPAGGRVAVLGVAFKTNTGDCRLTPTVPVLDRLEAAGYHVVVHDPFVEERDAEQHVHRALEDDVEVAVRQADCVAFFTGHDQFRAYDAAWLAARVKPGALVFDGRMYFDKPAIAAFRAEGLRYQGVGR